MPGAGKQTPEIQRQITELLEAGFDPTTIHRRLKVGRSSIYRMKRCLQQHGTPYMPSELNKKNGRPKVLSAEQELEVRDWLRKPENRTRYLDDLVWLIHDRFGIVCSTTTMSKLKRKWLRVLEFEETGQALDTMTWNSLLETHPDLPILQQPEARPPPPQEGEDANNLVDASLLAHDPQLQQEPQYPQHDPQLQQDSQYPQHDPQLQPEPPYPHHDPQLQHALPEAMMQHPPPPEALMQAPHAQMQQTQIPLEPQIDHRLEQQLHSEMGPMEAGRGWAIAGAEQGGV